MFAAAHWAMLDTRESLKQTDVYSVLEGPIDIYELDVGYGSIIPSSAKWSGQVLAWLKASESK